MTHYKHPILPPDLIKINILYTFTVSPDDSYQFFEDDIDTRIKKTTNHMNLLLSKYPNMDCVLHMDISRIGRVHWHGTIQFKHDKHIKNFFFEIITQLLKHHQIEIDTIADPQKWQEYCQKLPWLQIMVSTSTCSKKLKQLLLKSPNDPLLHKPITDY